MPKQIGYDITFHLSFLFSIKRAKEKVLISFKDRIWHGHVQNDNAQQNAD